MTDDPRRALAAKDARIAELERALADAETRIQQARHAIRDIRARGVSVAESDRLDTILTALNITGTHTEEP